jgi:SAM-dependent methyltransferase
MQLIDIVQRSKNPIPWAEGDNIPWNEPGFSRRMLKEHLSQDHDAASRRFPIIDQHVNWIHSDLLSQQPACILDLACGPGLYSSRLAARGHTCYGIDYSPASIEYAVSTARTEKLACTYFCQDIRQAEYPTNVALVMLIYGELNIFRPKNAQSILAKAWQSLEPGGSLLLEPHSYQLVEKMGHTDASWYGSASGLFSDQPYLLLRENHWQEEQHVTTTRYYVIDSNSAKVTRYAQSFQAYQDEEYRQLLAECGFEEIKILPGLTGEELTPGLVAIIARKPST